MCTTSVPLLLGAARGPPAGDVRQAESGNAVVENSENRSGRLSRRVCCTTTATSETITVAQSVPRGTSGFSGALARICPVRRAGTSYGPTGSRSEK